MSEAMRVSQLPPFDRWMIIVLSLIIGISLALVIIILLVTAK